MWQSLPCVRYGAAMPDAVDRLRKLALSFADVEETVACAGTAIEQAAFRTRGKAFLFAQRKGDIAIVRLKLDDSLDEARVADEVEVGKFGWVTCRLPLSKAPSATVKKWARESYGLFGRTKAKAKKKTVKKKTVKKKTAKKKPSVK
jgi:hypothetical protein